MTRAFGSPKMPRTVGLGRNPAKRYVSHKRWFFDIPNPYQIPAPQNSAQTPANTAQQASFQPSFTHSPGRRAKKEGGANSKLTSPSKGYDTPCGNAKQVVAPPRGSALPPASFPQIRKVVVFERNDLRVSASNCNYVRYPSSFSSPWGPARPSRSTGHLAEIYFCHPAVSMATSSPHYFRQKAVALDAAKPQHLPHP